VVFNSHHKLKQTKTNCCNNKQHICKGLFPKVIIKNEYGPFCPCYYYSQKYVIKKIRQIVNEYDGGEK